jgi:hypothetical protein
MNQFPYPVSQAKQTLAQTLTSTEQRLNSLIGIEKTNHTGLKAIPNNNETYPDSMLPAEITIPCTDGTITIPQNIWKKCHLFKDCIADTVAQTTPFTFDELQKFPKKLLADLFLCIAKPDYAYKISAKNYDKLLEAAAYFGAPRSIVGTLSDLKRNSWFHRIKKMFGSDGSDKFSNLAIQDLEKIDEFILHFYRLHNKSLESLSGIEKLSKELTTLDVSNNYLTVLNVDDLVKKFPKLSKLNASNNKIKEIKISKLPDNFSLTVQNNNIEKINLKHPWSAPENSYLNIENNQLEASELAKLKEQLIPGFWQKAREKFASQVKTSLLVLTPVTNALNNHINSYTGFWLYLSLRIARNFEMPPANEIFFDLTIPLIFAPIRTQIHNFAPTTAVGGNAIITASILSSIQYKLIRLAEHYSKNNTISNIIDSYLGTMHGMPLFAGYFCTLLSIVASPALLNKITNWNTTQYAFKPSKIVADNQKPKQKTHPKKLDELD